MKKIIDTDPAWAYVDWPKIPGYQAKKEKAKSKAKAGALSLVKRVAKSKKVHDKVKDFTKVQKIADDTYRITEDYVFNSYLFIGKHKALLVDTGLGYGNLKGVVKGLTDKPLTVVLTHGHFGTVGGASQFPSVLVGNEDLRMAKVFNKIDSKVLTVINKAGAKTNLEPTFEAFNKKKEEVEFDLGGRKIKALHVPSHTKGSFCYLDDKEKIAVIGDVAAPLGFNLLPGMVPLSAYCKALSDLNDKISDKKIYCTYFPLPISYDRYQGYKDLVYTASAYGNDTNNLVKFKKNDDWKHFQSFIYYGPRASRRDTKTLIKSIFKR